MKILLLLGLYTILTTFIFSAPKVISITKENRELRIKIGLEEDRKREAIIEPHVYIASKANPQPKDIYRFLGLRDYGKSEMISGRKRYIVWAIYKNKKGDNTPKWPLNQKYLYVAFGTNITPSAHEFVKWDVLVNTRKHYRKRYKR